MLQYKISSPDERVLVAYTLGEPMQAHLMIERLYKGRIRVGISTFRGYPTDVVLAASKYEFCSVQEAPPNNSFKPKPLRGSA